MTDELPTSAQLRQTQRDLAASQADLTRVERDRDEQRERLVSAWAERDEARHDLAHAEFQLTKTKAALDQLHADAERIRSWQVARESDVLGCWGCTRFIKRGEAVEPVPSMKGYFQHVHCADSPPNSGAGPREEHP